MKNNIKIVSLLFFMVSMLTSYSLAQPSNGDCSSAIPIGRTMRKTDSIVLHQFVSIPTFVNPNSTEPYPEHTRALLSSIIDDTNMISNFYNFINSLALSNADLEGGFPLNITANSLMRSFFSKSLTVEIVVSFSTYL